MYCFFFQSTVKYFYLNVIAQNKLQNLKPINILVSFHILILLLFTVNLFIKKFYNKTQSQPKLFIIIIIYLKKKKTLLVKDIGRGSTSKKRKITTNRPFKLVSLHCHSQQCNLHNTVISYTMSH